MMRKTPVVTLNVLLALICCHGLAREVQLDGCAQDVQTFCSTVEPGEARVYNCLIANEAGLTAACRNDVMALREQVQDELIDLYVVVPHLEGRELGQANTDAQGNQIIWGRPLPFMAQEVIDLGFELPLPFGISIIPAAFEQDLSLSDLKIGTSGIADTPIEQLNFDNPSVKNTALQLKFDAWLFPFMNVFATVGKVDGRATIPLSLPGESISPDRCGLQIGRPTFCDNIYSATAKPDYEGTNWSVGTALAMGWEQFFVVLPMVYAVSDIDLIDTDVDAINISPRIGINGDLGKYGDIAVFVGATYLKAEVEVAGSITFDVPAIGPNDREVTLNYQLIEENKDPWNAVAGANWQISPRWGFMMEAGFGGSRKDVIAGVTYRF